MILDLVPAFQGAPHVQIVSAAAGNSVATIFKKFPPPKKRRESRTDVNNQVSEPGAVATGSSDPVACEGFNPKQVRDRLYVAR